LGAGFRVQGSGLRVQSSGFTMLGFRYRVHAMAHRKKLGSTLFRKVFRNVFRNARHTSRPPIAIYVV
jgi:hypothetical protein